MSRKQLSIVFITIILSTLIIPLLPISAENPPGFYQIERGANFIREQNWNGTDWTGKYAWSSAPQWVYNGSHYVPFIFSETANYFQVQSGLIGARIFKSGYAEFWDPNMTEVRLYEETWEVGYYDQGRWKVCDTYSPEHTVSMDESTVNITASFITDWPNSGERSFTVKYIFREGSPLKHEIDFTSYATEQYEFNVTQKWAGIVATKVKHDNGEDVIISSQIVDGSKFRFLKEDGSLSIHENQWDMYYGRNDTTGEIYVLANENLKPVEIDVHSQGLKADFVFGTWSLSQGEILEIDPSTFSTDNPTTDGYLSNYFSMSEDKWLYYFHNDGDLIDLRAYHRPYRGYVQWDISGIPDDRYITNVLFKYHGSFLTPGESADCQAAALNVRPSSSSAETLWNYIGSGTLYVDPLWWPTPGTNKQVDLGTVADADLQSRLAGNWFAISLRDDDEEYSHYADSAGVYAEEYASATPKPTLYVEYQAYPTITSVTNTDMDDADNWYSMLKYYSSVVVVNDLDGASDISKVYLRGKNGAATLWDVRVDDLTGTPAWSIQIGSGVIDLDTGSCSWNENGNEGTATFKIRLEGDHGNLADLELEVYVEDSWGCSAGWTVMQTNYWDAIHRLVTTGLAASDGRVNIGATDTISGTVYYATTIGGNTASTSSPPNDQFTAVHLHDTGHVSRGSDTTIVSGAFSETFSIPGTVQNNQYHVYLDMTGDWPDGDAPDADTASVIGDQVHTTATSASDNRVNLDDNVNIDFTLKYDYDETLMVDGTTTIKGYAAAHQGSGVWRITQSRSTVQSVLYDEFTSSGNAQGITSVSSAGQSESVIWDRFNVTGLWASNENPITGETVYLYATGELAYDGHEPDAEDVLNISGVGFDWDWDEEWFYAEVNKSTPGDITYDTLTEIDEYSYGITVGTMDGNTVTVSWGSFEVHFLGLFSENGTFAGSVNVTALLPSGANIFTVDGSEDKGFEETPEMFSFPLAGGGYRYIYSFQDNETLYLFTPDATYSVYSFTIRDYTGQIGKDKTYLESLRIVNGTERMIERQVIWDTANAVPLTLVQSQIYALQVRFADNSTYRFGYFIPGAEATPTLSIYDIAFSDEAHIPAEYILVEGQRPSDTHIRLNYKDELDETEEVFVEVCLLNGTQVWNDTGTSDILQFNWYNAVNETDYMVQVEMTHGFYGELTYTCWLAGAQADFEDPFDLSLFGDWPITGAFSVFIIIGCACLFSRGSAVIGMGVTVIIAATLTGIGWIDIPYTVLATVFGLVVMWGLSGGSK